MSLILLFSSLLSLLLLIYGFLKSNAFSKYIGFLILFIILFVIIYFIFLTPPENMSK